MKTTKKMMALAAALVLGVAVGVFRARVGSEAPGNTYYLFLGAGAVLLAVIGAAMGKAPAPETQSVRDGFKSAVVLAGLGVLGGTVLMVSMLVGGTMDILTGCALALLFVAGLGMIVGLRRQEGEVQAVFSTVPVFAMGVFLLAVYKQYVAACPNVHRYALEVLTMAALTLALYAVSSMRFLDRSQSFLVSASVLIAVFLAAALMVSVIMRNDFIFGFAQSLVCAAFALNCGAWYLNPPVKYTPPSCEAACGEETGDPEDVEDGSETDL